jgi:glyoxylate/hydroxypyruvate/2-ketogluconate reductase
MKPKVVVYKKVPLQVKEIIESHCEVSYFEDLSSFKEPIFLNALKEANGLLGSGLKIDNSFLEHAPRLQIVSNSSAGYDNLNLDDMTNRKVMATNTPDVLTDTTADTIFGLLLSTARRIPEVNNLVKNGHWDEKISEDFFGADVHHKVLGIIGMGRIGSAIAKRAKLGFDMEILYHNRNRNVEAEKNYGATFCGLEELLSSSDYVCVMVPFSETTKYLLGENEFKLMKKSSILIVGSRGGIVNELELSKALKERTIRGAGLDVFEKEPTEKNNPLLQLENVVTLPHIGSATHETRLNMDLLAVENLIKGLSGQTPPNLLNKELLSLI